MTNPDGDKPSTLVVDKARDGRMLDALVRMTRRRAARS